jgi:hypothetical protein
MLLFAVVAIVLAWRPAAEWRTLARLRDDGETAEARVTGSTIDASGRFSVDVLHYEFQPPGDGPAVSGVDRISVHEVSGGDPSEISRRFSHNELSVRYLPGDPGVHRLDVFLPLRLGHARNDTLLFLCAAAVLGCGGTFMLARG